MPAINSAKTYFPPTMQLRRAAAAAAVLFCSLFLFPTTTDAHNITRILQKHPELSTFNNYLSRTHLAPLINQRTTITVCAVDNAGMKDLLSRNLDIGAIKNVLSLHVLLDYFDAKKLHQITDGTAIAATMFQATGSASGSSGFVNITDLKGGRVGFSVQDGNGNVSATFVKTVQAIPYNISIIQISTILHTREAEAPAPGPSKVNLTAVMSGHGCKIFAETLLANQPAEQTFEDNVESGLTVFCPGDDAMKGFLPKYKNLSAEGKQSLLEYHGMPIYQSLSGLRSSNGLTNSLATDGANYDFTVQNNGTGVTIQTKIVTAKIVRTLFDEPQLAIYELDKVLMPKELFKSALAPTPSPAPAPEADAESPKSSPKHKPSPPAPPTAPSDSPADAPDGDVADQNADGNAASRFNGRKFGPVILSIWFVFLQL